MKKKIIYCVLFFGLLTANIQAEILSIMAIVSGVSAAYASFVPNAEYVVSVYASDGSSSITVNSANAAINAKNIALANGANKVHIESTYPTIYRDADDNWYYK